MTDRKQRYVSPLSAINEEVRRKHGAASNRKSQQVAAAADPWDEQEITGEPYPHYSLSYQGQDSACRCPGRRQSLGSSSERSPLRKMSSSSISGDILNDMYITRTSSITDEHVSDCLKCRKPMHPGRSLPHTNTFHSGMLNTFKAITTLRGPDHAEALLETTPQLRFMSPASKGEGPLRGSNLLLMYISQAVDGNSDGQAMPSVANDLDYNFSIERDRINKEVAAELASLLWVLAHEMSFEEYGALESTVFTSVFRLIHANEKLDKMAGLAAVAALLPVPSADTERKVIKLANSLSHGLRAINGDFETMKLCAANLGTLATLTASVDFVEAEITRALEWLQMERSDRRLAACLAFKEFAINLPTTFYSRTSSSTLSQEGSNEFLDHIFGAIRDPQPIVRACAADALTQCLKIIVNRGQLSLTTLLCQVYNFVKSGLEEKPVKHNSGRNQLSAEAAQHGSLLAISSLLAHCQAFVGPRFHEICEAVFSLCLHDKPLIRLEVIRIIPRLAFRSPQVFGRHYLDHALHFLMDCASPSPGGGGGIPLQPSAFTSLGQLFVALVDGETGQVIGGTNEKTFTMTKDRESGGWIVEMRNCGVIYEHLSSIFQLVRTGLIANSDKGSTVRAALHCATSIVEALGDAAIPYLPDLTVDMFRAGLSVDLIHCLRSITSQAPSQKNQIEDRILQGISKCLANNTTDPLSSYKNFIRRGRGLQTVDKMIEFDIAKNSATNKNIILALETLSSLGNDEGMISTSEGKVPLLPFVRDIVSLYIEHPDSEVRKAASLTCCNLLVPPPLSKPDQYCLGGLAGKCVESILYKLIRSAVADSDQQVRLTIIEHLDNRYDPYLLQTPAMRRLFVLVQDETISNRSAAVSLLSRLAVRNPSVSLPLLRNLLRKILLDLNCGLSNGRSREEATRLLVVFLRSKSLQRLFLPILPQLVSSLSLDKDAPPRLASALLEALGELAQAAGEALQPWIHQMVPHLLDMMEDRSSASKQRTSLRTLGQISGSTGYVIRPYFDYPKLLMQATNILPAAKRAPWSLRREVIRTLGIMGALDPLRHKKLAARTHSHTNVGSAYFEDALDASGHNPQLTAPPIASRFDNHIPVDPNDEIDQQPASLFMYEQYAMVAQPITGLVSMKRMTPSDDDFFPNVVVQALVRILRDPSLSVHHVMVLQALMFVFKSLGFACVPFLPKVVPHVLSAVKPCGSFHIRETLLLHLDSLASLVREHIRPFIEPIFDVADDLWSTRHLPTILSLLVNLSRGAPDEFKLYMPRFLRKTQATFEMFQSSDWRPVGSGTHLARSTEELRLLLKTFRDLVEIMPDFLHVSVPALLRLIDTLAGYSTTIELAGSGSVLTELLVQSVRTVAVLLEGLLVEQPALTTNFLVGGGMSRKNSEIVMSSTVVQPLVRIFIEKPPKSQHVGLTMIEALCVCILVIGPDEWIALHHRSVRTAIKTWQDSMHSQVDGAPGYPFINCLELYEEAVQSESLSVAQTIRLRTKNWRQKYQLFSAQVGDHDFVQSDNNEKDDLVDQATLTGTQGFSGTNRQRLNQARLQRAWDVSQRVARDDWEDWMRRFSIQLLKEAPSAPLRATASLAHAYQPLARELFSAAFACCWKELNDSYRSNLVQALKMAFVADVSPEISQALLHLAEFMEHDESGGLPIEINVLADLALKCRAYAKALYYKEREYATGKSASCVEALIRINGKLDLPEAALGLLTSCGDNETPSDPDGHIEESLYDQPRQHAEMYYSVMHNTGSTVPGFNRQNIDVALKTELWLAKLGAWTEALSLYETRLKNSPNDTGAVVGCMRCFSANAEWREILDLADHHTLLDPSKENPNRANLQRKANRMCANAAWRLGQWGDLERYAEKLVSDEANLNHSPGPAPTSNDGIASVDFDGALYSTVLHIHQKSWTRAASTIDAARRAMDSRLAALMTESYGRAYRNMVAAQNIAEMEEIVEYLKLEDDARRSAVGHPANHPDPAASRKRMLSVWKRRLAGCSEDAEVYDSILSIRSLVLRPEEAVEEKLHLSELARQHERSRFGEHVLLEPLEKMNADINGECFGFSLPINIALECKFLNKADRPNPIVVEKILAGELESIIPEYGQRHEELFHQLLQRAGSVERLRTYHQFYFGLLKHYWCTNRKEEAVSRLERLSKVVDLVTHFQGRTDIDFQVKCWLQLGEWKLKRASVPGVNAIPESLQAEILTAYKRATLCEETRYHSWHAWALLNFRIAQQIRTNELGLDVANQLNPQHLRNHVVAGAQGFANAISIGTKEVSASVQQDLLNLATCLFKFGTISDVAARINDAIKPISIDAWLGVLPQLLARIHIMTPTIRSVLHPLLKKLGEKHPQALMYPLSVLLKSPVSERKHSAESLMSSLKNHSKGLVEEALMVSTELIRVAILWLETFFQNLEDASTLYYGEGNVAGMLDILLPLHEEIERGANTSLEAEFIFNYGQQLERAYGFLKELVAIGGRDCSQLNNSNSDKAEALLVKIWNLYYEVFGKINRVLPTLKKLDLSRCSSALFRARGLELSVPGTYRVDGSYVNIEKFESKLEVISSKQRPRKITMRGSDGKDYVFLLKGHEDLRQDERVMQLFGLVNALLRRDNQTSKEGLMIQRYAIAPLSHNCGVVGWVPNSDTMHSLIHDYRKSKKILLSMEAREMQQITQDYDQLPVMGKIEVFTTALRKTTGNGNDLYEIMWMKSVSSEEWLDRRTRFTRSLAVMSMVGYILGLGDRHPSNLMLGKKTGRVLHIDFGDCFEVAQHREKFPERIPFRLTRMLIRAMEVSGIEGSYRSTCEKTMTVLRDSRDSLIAMLEAFVYDPLISWRYLANNLPSSDSDRKDETEGSTKSPDRPLGTPIASLRFDPIAEDATEAETERARNRAQSLQIYRSIHQANPDARIASVVGGNNAEATASLAHSRLERSMRQREIHTMFAGGGGSAHEEALNKKALSLLRRVEDKLNGTDFGEPLEVPEQVQRLLIQATSCENLCQLYIGWCAFW